jgi:hypothetical protein
MDRRRALELYRAPFPLYALQIDPSAGLLIAAGGGGAAKTGIKNGVVRARGLWCWATPWVQDRTLAAYLGPCGETRHAGCPGADFCRERTHWGVERLTVE